MFISGGTGLAVTETVGFGWSTSHERHNDWLSLATVAETSISLHDSQNYCAGPVDVVGIEGVFFANGN